MSAQPTVLVTGASGFIASYLVKLLLARGYTVRGTVRSLTDEAKVAHLRALEGAADRLSLFEADLLAPGSFDEACAGVACVFHTASPFFFEGGCEDNLVRPAVEGTLNVLGSVAKNPSVTSVVLTSSNAAICVDYGTRPAEHVYTEADWSPEDVLREKQNWYCLSKTLAERAAWAWAQESESRPRLVTINPCLVLGPMLQPSMNTSSSFIMNKLDGSTQLIRQVGDLFVDVRDVAEAHVAAFENAAAEGRYMMHGVCSLWETTCAALRTMFPDNANIPTELDPEIPSAVIGPQPPALTLFDCSKVEGLLGRPLLGLQEMLQGTVEGLQAHGHLPAAASA